MTRTQKPYKLTELTSFSNEIKQKGSVVANSLTRYKSFNFNNNATKIQTVTENNKITNTRINIK